MRRQIAATVRAAPVRAGSSCTARHRTFVDRLQAARRNVQRPASLSLVLVRLLRPLMKRGTAWLSFALTVIARGALGAAPVPHIAQRVAGAPHAALESPRQRLLERIIVQRSSSTGVREHERVERIVAGTRLRSERRLMQIMRNVRIEQAAAYPRATVVFARAAAVPMRQPTDPTPAPQRDVVRPEFGTHPMWQQSVAGDALPPQELARVTEHVLAQLDRKVLSFRERHGQI